MSASTSTKAVSASKQYLSSAARRSRSRSAHPPRRVPFDRPQAGPDILGASGSVLEGAYLAGEVRLHRRGRLSEFRSGQGAKSCFAEPASPGAGPARAYTTTHSVGFLSENQGICRADHRQMLRSRVSRSTFRPSKLRPGQPSLRQARRRRSNMIDCGLVYGFARGPIGAAHSLPFLVQAHHRHRRQGHRRGLDKERNSTPSRSARRSPDRDVPTIAKKRRPRVVHIGLHPRYSKRAGRTLTSIERYAGHDQGHNWHDDCSGRSDLSPPADFLRSVQAGQPGLPELADECKGSPFDVDPGNFLVKRIAQGLLIVFITSLIIFTLLRVVPGDPARLTVAPGMAASRCGRGRWATKMGLRDPIIVQYGHYMRVCSRATSDSPICARPAAMIRPAGQYIDRPNRTWRPVTVSFSNACHSRCMGGMALFVRAVDVVSGWNSRWPASDRCRMPLAFGMAVAIRVDPEFLARRCSDPVSVGQG